MASASTVGSTPDLVTRHLQTTKPATAVKTAPPIRWGLKPPNLYRTRGDSPPSYTKPDDAYIVTVESVDWPRWTEIEKSGAVVGERPLKDSEGQEVTGNEIPISQGGAWEFCIVNVRVRVVDISALDQ